MTQIKKKKELTRGILQKSFPEVNISLSCEYDHKYENRGDRQRTEAEDAEQKQSEYPPPPKKNQECIYCAAGLKAVVHGAYGKYVTA